MFFAVIAAYMVAAAFALCGVVAVAHCIIDAQQEMGYTLFIQGLALAMWPLAVAAALLLLIQIACKVERWMLLWTMAQAPAPARAPHKAAATPEQKSAARKPAEPDLSYFGSYDPPVTPPVMEATPAPPEPTPSETPASGAGAVAEQHPAEQAAARPAPPPASNGLSFFKLD